MAFPALDVVFGLTTGAIDFLVKILAAMAAQTGHDKARVGPMGPTSMRAMTRRSPPHEWAP